MDEAYLELDDMNTGQFFGWLLLMNSKS